MNHCYHVWIEGFPIWMDRTGAIPYALYVELMESYGETAEILSVYEEDPYACLKEIPGVDSLYSAGFGHGTLYIGDKKSSVSVYSIEGCKALWLNFFGSQKSTWKHPDKALMRLFKKHDRGVMQWIGRYNSFQNM